MRGRRTRRTGAAELARLAVAGLVASGVGCGPAPVRGTQPDGPPALDAAEAAALAIADGGVASLRLVGLPERVTAQRMTVAQAHLLTTGYPLDPVTTVYKQERDRPVWLVFVAGELGSGPAAAIPALPGAPTPGPPPAYRLMAMEIDAVTGAVRGGSAYPVGREPAAAVQLPTVPQPLPDAGTVRRRVAARVTAVPPVTPAPSATAVATRIPTPTP